LFFIYIKNYYVKTSWQSSATIEEETKGEKV
jgi:hypothetical protein